MFKPFTPEKLRRRVFSQLWMFAVQFILGMVANLIGEDAKGTLHTVYVVSLVLHILTAIGLVEGAVFIALKAPSKLSWWIVVALIITSAAGSINMMAHQDVWSFVMAVGFVISTWLTGMQYVQVDREVSASKSSKK